VRLKVVVGPLGHGLIAGQSLKAGDAVITLEGAFVDSPTRYTIQFGPDRHLQPTDQLWAFLNHSCDPNLRVDIERKAMVATSNIQEGEALTFNYLTTEWEMAEPFQCQCGSSNCHGTIAGSKFVCPEHGHSLIVWEMSAGIEVIVP
jgi:hypothetical protein